MKKMMQRNAGPLTVLLALVVAGVLAAGAAGAVPPVSFDPKTDRTTGSYPSSVAFVDLNGDGFLDLAVVNHGDEPEYAGSVSAWLGDGAGGFGPRSDFACGRGAWAIESGDFDRDGHLDMATLNHASTVSVLLGDGAGGLGAATDYPVPGVGPYGIAIGDVNGDGILDAAVANSYSTPASVSVLLGTGAGGFGAATDYGTGDGPWDVAIKDLNGDGEPDLVTANAWSNSVGLLLGDGAGGFGLSTDFATGSAPYAVAIGDLNADGKPDVATANAGANTASVLLGDGTGGFGAHTDFATGTVPSSVEIGDLNGDGKLDLIVANSISSTVSVLLGDGAGGFETRADFGTGQNPKWAAIGDVNRDGRPDLATDNYYSNTVSLLLNTTPGSTIAPQPPATCTPAHACVAVPVNFTRVDTTPVRGFSVTLTLSSELALCPPEIVEGRYLSGIGGTHFEVFDQGGGSYTVDCAILGLPCGATGNGTLFTVHVGLSPPSSAGTVIINSVTVRDCDNAPLSAFPGPPATIRIDDMAPAAIADLAAAKQRTGNDGDGTTAIDLSFTAPADAAKVHLYRAGWGHYPEYDDEGGGVPATPGYPPSAPWALAATLTAPVSTYADEVGWPKRDFWYYVAFVEDACGNVSAVSNKTGGTLNYHLGDVHNGTADCAGDNWVDLSDISFLAAHYRAPVLPAWNCLDVGPTTKCWANGRPTTDNKVNFEDLMVFAINYGQVSAPQDGLQSVAAASDELWVEGPAQVTAGAQFTVSLRLKGAGDLQGLSAQLGWDAAVAEPVSVEAGALIAAQNGVVLSSGAGNVDAALLGANRGLAGEGVLATVTFRALGSGSPNVVLAKLDARDMTNQPVALEGVKPAVTVATWFAPAMPNPFRGTTVLSYALAKGGAVELVVYGVDGRKVAVLASGVQAAGTHRLTWDGAGAEPGLYFARLTTPEGRFHRTLVLTR